MEVDNGESHFSENDAALAYEVIAVTWVIVGVVSTNGRMEE